NTSLQQVLTDHITLYGGLSFTQQKTESYKEIEDLLGGDFFIDLNSFAESEYNGNTTVGQNNLDIPNHLVKEGDKYNYDYISRFSKGLGWAQASFTYNRVDFFAAASYGMNSFSREGLFRNGLYPNNSLGKGETRKFSTYGL